MNRDYIARNLTVPLICSAAAFLTVVIFSDIFYNMDIPGISTVFSILIPVSDTSISYGLLIRVFIYFVLLCSLIISFICLGSVLTEIPFIGGLFTFLGVIAGVYFYFGSFLLESTFLLILLGVFVYESNVAGRVFSGLVEFRPSNIASATAVSFMFITAILTAVSAYIYLHQHIDELKTDMSENLLSFLGRFMGIEKRISCESGSIGECLTTTLLDKVKQGFSEQLLSQFSDIGCNRDDILFECLKENLRREYRGQNIDEAMLDKATEKSFVSMIEKLGLKDSPKYRRFTVSELINSAISDSSEVKKQIDSVSENIKSVESILDSFFNTIPYLTAFGVYSVVNFSRMIVVPASTIILYILFSILSFSRIIKKKKVKIEVTRYVVNIGGEERGDETQKSMATQESMLLLHKDKKPSKSDTTESEIIDDDFGDSFDKTTAEEGQDDDLDDDDSDTDFPEDL